MKGLRKKTFDAMVQPFKAPASLLVDVGSPAHDLPPVSISVGGSEHLVDAIRLAFFDFAVKDGGARHATTKVMFDTDPSGRKYGLPIQLPRSSSVVTAPESTNVDDNAELDDEVAEQLAENDKLLKNPWRQASLNDWTISQRVVVHSSTDHQLITRVKQNAALFQDHLGPFQRSAYFVNRENLSDWLVVTRDANSLVRDDVFDALDFAYWGALLPLLGGCWMPGDAVTNAAGKTVVILGGPRSGKTTLALHCLSRRPDLSLTSTSHVLLHNMGGRSRHLPLVAGSLRPPVVSLGSMLGTLLPNPHLERLVDAKIAADAVKNSDRVLWNLRNDAEVNVAEVFGPRRRRLFGQLVGVVWLDWDIASAQRTFAGSVPVETVPFAQHEHPVLSTVHRADTSNELPIAILKDGGVPVEVIGGRVRFEPVVKLVTSMLSVA